MNREIYNDDFLLSYARYYLRGNIDHINVIDFGIYSVSYYIYDKDNNKIQPSLKPEYIRNDKNDTIHTECLIVHHTFLDRYKILYDRKQKINYLMQS